MPYSSKKLFSSNCIGQLLSTFLSPHLTCAHYLQNPPLFFFLTKTFFNKDILFFNLQDIPLGSSSSSSKVGSFSNFTLTLQYHFLEMFSLAILSKTTSFHSQTYHSLYFFQSHLSISTFSDLLCVSFKKRSYVCLVQ